MNTKGASIVEVLVAAGAMGILMMAVTSMITSQQRELKSLSEKISQLDLEKNLLTNLTEACTAELTNNTINSLAPYMIAPNQNIHLTHLHASGMAGAPYY